MAELWDGTAWTQVPIAGPASSGQPSFNSVECLTARFCLASGTYRVSANQIDPLSELWNGTGWRIERVHLPRSQVDSSMIQTSCMSPTSCIAVGSTSEVEANGFYLSYPLLDRWNGTGWSPAVIVKPRGGYSTDMEGIDCTSTRRCLAVGWSQLPSGQSVAVSLEVAGDTLTFAPVPTTGAASFDAVSCFTAADCVAVGDAGSLKPLVERWDGSNWTRVKDATNAPYRVLQGVSCWSTTRCATAGYQGNNANQFTAYRTAQLGIPAPQLAPR